ncbi:asparagine synthase [Halorubellus sp. JP-L1]|uniref:asparagine synthase-related protein n=1 Tax=Halorubellus sp. JP-L1 TaxID=2715753 RepID=UPI001408364A|nr:asparagine synthase-related protein [Halorubellus sp. JP-L1]NHN43556.1 asparagine synthase [Halorubellus sp. JP-L1]
METTRLLGPGWSTDDGVAARGRAWTPDGRRADLASAFASARTLTSVAATARRLDGFYAVVVDTDDAVFLVCDHARSVPLYFDTSESIVVGDSTRELVGDDRELDPLAASEFALTRYVTRGETVYANVAAVRAGEVVAVPRADPGSFERRRYARYRPTTAVEGDEATLLDAMDDVLAGVFDRVVDVADGRRVAVPLSGGVDSRLVAATLVDRGVDVLGFAFGVHGHADVEVSRDVADALGIDWAFIEYTPERWHDWYHSAARRDYHEYAFGGDALPFLAEWPAVKELQSRGVLDDALVCPGHTVATPSERVPASWLAEPPDADGFVSHVLDEHYSLWAFEDERRRATFADRIRADAGLGAGAATAADADAPGGDAIPAYEEWEWTTRMATFTNGDARCYDWFGLDWWLPLWDPAYVRFWASVPAEHRLGKRLQTEYTARRFRAVADVDEPTARRTDADWTPVDQVRRTFETRPWVALDGDLEDWLGAQAVPPSNVESWGNYPLGWYGVIPREDAGTFDAARSLYSLRTLAALDELSFGPGCVVDGPLTETLSLPPTESTSPGATDRLE